MTRKDYRLLADAMVEMYDRAKLDGSMDCGEVSESIASALNSGYTNFDRSKWFSYIEKETALA